MPGIFEIVDAGFDGADREGEPAVVWRHPTPDGREAVVTGARLCIGPPGDAASGDAYDYATTMAAILGAARWIEAQGRLWCPVCRHHLDDAVHVPWPPQEGGPATRRVAADQRGARSPVSTESP